MKNYNVLIFPCGTEVGNEVINSLKNHKYFRLKFASSEKKSYCNFRGKEVHYLPYVSDEFFVRELNDLIIKEEIDFIVSGHDDVAYALAKIEEIILAKVIGQSYKVNNIVRFKDVTYEFFKNSLPIATIFETIPSKKDFPVFVKPIRGQGSQNALKLADLERYNDFFKNFDIKEFIVMENLSGEEFTIDCFSDKGKTLYFGARTREKTTRGITTQSTFITDEDLNKEFKKYADTISKELNLHGIWFFQMKFDKNNQLKLLEVGPRVSGSMMLSRARGVNFIELAIFQKMGFPVEVVFNDIEISLGRALLPIYTHNIKFNKLYIDFDDTLFLDEKTINVDIIKLIFQAKNQLKEVILITKNKKNNLTTTLHKYGITNIFDEIIHLRDIDSKASYMFEKSLLIDDSFQERKEVILSGHYAYGVDALSLFENEYNF